MTPFQLGITYHQPMEFPDTPNESPIPSRNPAGRSAVLYAAVRGSVKPAVRGEINAAVRGSPKPAVRGEINAAVGCAFREGEVMSGSLCHHSHHLHKITLTCVLIICTCQSPIKPPIKSCSTQSQMVRSTVHTLN